jgi:hypothetical protein
MNFELKLASLPSPDKSLERSRWRDRFACYAQHVMLQGGAFSCDFSLSCFFCKSCKLNKLQTKKDSIPIAIKWGSAAGQHPPQTPTGFLLTA